MNIQERPLPRVLAVAMGILVVGLIVYAVKTGTPLRYHDEREYLEIARGISNGEGFNLDGSPTAYRPPSWPLLLAICLFLGLPEALLSVVSAALMVAAAVVASAVGVRLSGSMWGGLAGAALLLYPMNIYTAITLYPQALATLLIVSLWLLALYITDDVGNRNRAAYILAGLIAASLALAVPILAFTGVIVIVWLVVISGGDRLRAISYTLMSFVIPIAVWAVRNMRTLGEPIALSTTGGVNLLIGNNPSATGSSGVDVEIDHLRDAAGAMTEVDADNYLRNAALNWIIHNPAESLKLYFAKVVNYFAPYNEPVTLSQGTDLQRVVAYVSFATLVLLVVARLMLRRRLPLHQTERLFLGIFLANSLVMAVFFTRTRFRQPLDSILLIEAAIGAVVLAAILINRRRLVKAGDLSGRFD